MKKFFKVFAVIFAIIIAAGGGMALGYFLPRFTDEFANAEIIPYTQFDAFQKDGAVNTLDGGYEVIMDNTTLSTDITMTSYLSAKVEALAKGSPENAVANMTFTVKFNIDAVTQGVAKKQRYNLKVTVVNTKVSSQDTVMIYFETASGKYSSTYEDLKRMKEEEEESGIYGMSGDMNLQIPSLIESLNTLRKLDMSQIQKEDVACRRVISGDTTKFEVKEFSSDTEFEIEDDMKLVYNKKQLVEYSKTDKTKSIEYNSTDTHLVSVKKGFNGTIKAPTNTTEYQKYESQ